MLLALHGTAVSKGYAIGPAFILHRDQPEVVEYVLPTPLIEDEVQRLHGALAGAMRELESIRERIAEAGRVDLFSFIETHLLMLGDSTLRDAPAQLIRERSCNAEWALKLQRDRVVAVFEAMDDPYLRSRKDDVDHVVRRVLRLLLAEDGATHLEETGHRLDGKIIVADDLTPADTLLMQHQGVSAFITEHGGPLSHTAILARSLGIPALVGVRHARRYLRDDETLIVDGHHGVVMSGEDPSALAFFRQRQKDDLRQRKALTRLRKTPAVTLDGHAATLEANIELPEDTAAARREGAEGVGLYRTEFLFMNRDDVPDEEEHLAAYLHVIRALEGKPITIRTTDLGADKQVDGGRHGSPVVTNPALGLRAVRLCLRDLDLFRPQLLAILRASAHGPVRMMIPMLCSVQEVRQVLRLTQEARDELTRRGQAFDPAMPIGGMVEVPAAAICAHLFARELDFLSIGTNDLIQYTLAIDRIDDEVNYLYDPLHPAVLSLIQMTIKAGERARIPVSMCGEMAGDRRYTRLLLGLGLTRFSMHPSALIEVKQMVNSADRAELRGMASRLLKIHDGQRFSELLEQLVDR